MNAFDLADFIETGGENIDRKELANILRQQADRIAMFEKPSKPVAWIPKGMTLAKPKDLTDCIPLYTTPQTKPLSDEEIEEIIKHCIEDDYKMIANPYAVARAIEERHGIK